MKAIELAETIFAAFPKAFERETTKAVWGDNFTNALSQYEGPRLKKAYDITMATWKHAWHPKPSDFIKNIPQIAYVGPYNFRGEIYAKQNIDEAFKAVKEKHPQSWQLIKDAYLEGSAGYDIKDVVRVILVRQYQYDWFLENDPPVADKLYRPDYLSSLDRAALSRMDGEREHDPFKVWAERAKRDLLPQNAAALEKKKREFKRLERKYQDLKA